MRIGPVLARPDAANGFQDDFVTRVARSFGHVTGRDLFVEAGIKSAEPGPGAWNGNFALLTHRGDPQAMLNYANRFALRLWEMDWGQFTATPSAATTPQDGIEERRQMMDQVAREGFVAGYEGRRISRSGKLFVIRDVTVFRLDEPQGGSFGVAAFFRRYEYL